MRGIYVSEVDEVDGPDGTLYRARLKSHPQVEALASNADTALRFLTKVTDAVNAHRAERGVPPLKADGERSKTLTGRLHGLSPI